MDSIWIIAILLFILTVFIVWKLSVGRFKKEFSEKRRKLSGQRTFYWEQVIGVSFGITFLILFLLRQANFLTF